MDNVNLQQMIPIVMEYTRWSMVNISDWLADMSSDDFFLVLSEGLYSPWCTSSAWRKPGHASTNHLLQLL